MFRAMLSVQWKWTRGAVLVATILGFAVPLAAVQSLDPEAMAQRWGGSALYVVMRMQEFGVAFVLLSAGIGLVFALAAWSSDHRGRHVYALSLPIARSHYAAMRFGAGALFLLLPALGVLVGALVAVSLANIPPGLHAYPVSLAVRFLLASGVAFSIFFAIAAATPKAAAMVLGSLGALLVASFVLSTLNIPFDLPGTVVSALFGERGPLAVFTGRWMLIDA